MGKPLVLGLLSMVFLTHTHSMIMRNNALMSKMVSQFQGKEKQPRDRIHEDLRKASEEIEKFPDKKSEEHVLTLMQNVLCKNFPSVPCELITKDGTLKNLIEKSIQQLEYKKIAMDKPTVTSPPSYQLTLFPVINSEDLSNFLQVSNTGFFKPKKTNKKKIKEKNLWTHEKKLKSKTSLINGRKKIRKFYPHKIKYKDKTEKRDFADYSDEKLSMSVEVPKDHNLNVLKKHYNYRDDPADPPVWRIDYMKHGEPSLTNMFGFEADSLSDKIIKTGPNVIVDDNVLEHAARRDVLHPDLYIKKKYSRKIITNSEAVE